MNAGSKSMRVWLRVLAARMRPSFASSWCPLRSVEGAGKTGCLLHPRSRVRFALKNMHTSIQGSGSIPAFPAQWLYGLLRALPGERLFCLRRHRRRELPAQLRRQHRGARTTRLRRTLQARTSMRALSVHRISPHVRDDREAPLIRRETGGVMPTDLRDERKRNIFAIRGLDTISENRK